MDDDIRSEVIESFINNDDNHATELIQAHKPKYLYKYRSGSVHDFKALEEKSIWISRATEMDDEEDGRLYISDDFKKKFEDAREENPKFNDTEYVDSVYNLAEKTKNESFISSFSELNDNEDMWKRYANNNCGFCLEYRFEDIFIIKMKN